MTVEKDVARTEEAVVAVEADDTGATVVGVIGDDRGVQAVGAIVTDYDYAVVVAAFADETAAMAAYQGLQEAESTGRLRIEGVLVIKTDADAKVHIQKMTDHSTKTGVKWGAVGGLVLGIVFPPSIIASTVAVGAFGGVLGKIRNESHRAAVGEALAGALGPNESGVLALVKATDVAGAKDTMPDAKKVRTAGVDDATAAEITAAAKEAS